MPGVEAVVGAASVGTSLEYLGGGGPGAAAASQDAFAGVFFAMPRFAWRQPPIIAPSDAEETLGQGEVMLPSSYLGTDLRQLVGASLRLEYTVRTGEAEGTSATKDVRVAGIYDSTSTRSDGESALYVSESDFQALLAALVGSPGGTLPEDHVYSAGWIKASSVAEANTLATALTKAGYYINSGGGIDALPRALQALEQANALLALLLAIFGLGIGVTMAGTWSGLRRWDVGVLTSLGWSSGQILRVYATELALVGVVVGASAVVLGTLATAVLSLLLAGQTVAGFQLESTLVWPPITWLVAIMLGSPIALVAGGSVRVLRLCRIEPDVALRRVE
jgi:ABC-type lipoprotein release transport system permease subunit